MTTEQSTTLRVMRIEFNPIERESRCQLLSGYTIEKFGLDLGATQEERKDALLELILDRGCIIERYELTSCIDLGDVVLFSKEQTKQITDVTEEVFSLVVG